MREDCYLVVFAVIVTSTSVKEYDDRRSFITLLSNCVPIHCRHPKASFVIDEYTVPLSFYRFDQLLNSRL